jgi:sugar phosphate isomerase/epimerase
MADAAAAKRLPGRWCLSGHAFSSWTPDALLDQAAAWGIGAIDYWPWNKGRLSASAFAAMAAERGLDLACANVPSSTGRLLAPDEAAASEAILHAVMETHDTGARFVQVYVAAPTDADSGAAVKRLVERLRPLVHAAAEAGAMILIENNLDQRDEDVHCVNPSRRPESLVEVAQIIDSAALRLTFDPCNFLATGNDPFPTSYRLMRPYTVNVHLKDCVRYQPEVHAKAPMRGKLLVDSHQGPHLPAPVGQGSVPWPAILAALAEDGYQGMFTLDPFVEEARLVEWCDQSVSWLRDHLPAYAFTTSR